MQRHMAWIGAMALLAVLAAAMLLRGGELAPAAPGTSPDRAIARDGHASPPASAAVAEGVLRTAADPITATPDATAAEPPAVAGAPPENADDLLLAVRTADGRPTDGVAVGVRVDAVQTQLVWSGTTAGGQGLARWSRGRTLLQRHATDGSQFAAVLGFPLVEGPEVGLDPKALPPDPIVLSMPPTGSVAIVIDDANGIADGDISVELGSPQVLLRGRQFVVRATERPERGTASFPHVGLGQRWRASVARAGLTRRAEVEFAGPQLPGQAVVVHVALTPPALVPVLVVHLLDEQDRPLADRQVAVALSRQRPGSSSSSTFSLSSDREGVLRLTLDGDTGEAARRRLLLRLVEPPPRSADVSVPDQLQPGVNDLGDARLLPPPCLCSGVVLGSDGAPLPRATVAVQQRRNVGTGTWQTPRGLSTEQTAADGRFAIHGLVDHDAGDEVGIQVEADGMLPYGPEPFTPGADLRIMLHAAATITGTVMLGDIVQLHDVTVELIDAHGMVTTDARLRPDGARGAFRFSGLRSGTANVRIRVVGEPNGLVVDGVALAAGKTTVDPRLQDIDLNRGRRVVHFAVVEANDGSPVKDARAVLLPADPQATAFEGYLLDHGAGRIVTAQTAAAILVFAPEHSTARIPNLQDGQVIPLRAALAVRLQLPTDCSVPASCQLEASLAPDDDIDDSKLRYELRRGSSDTESGSGGAPWRGSISGRCSSSGSVVLRVPDPGAYEVTWRLRRDRQQVPVGRPAKITVAENAAEQAIRADISAADLAAAATALNR